MTQFGQCSANSTNFKANIIALVVLLFLISYPLAIFGIISFGIILAINALSFWTFPHVGKKSLETVLPLGTNRYPPSSVVAVLRMLRIAASSFHANPSNVSAAFLTSFGMPMLEGAKKCLLPTEAPARFGQSIGKRVNADDKLFSALASTKAITPYLSAWRNFARRVRNYFKSCEGPSDKGYFRRHGVVRFNAVFSGGMAAVTASRCASLPQTHERIN